MELSNIILRTTSIVAKVLPDRVKVGIYRIKPLAQAVRFGLNQAAPEGLTLVKISSGNLKGFQCYLDLKTEKDFWLGTYEVQLQKALKNFVHEGEIGYDVGANIGYMSLMMASIVGEHGHIFAFEAFEQNVQRMQKNITVNQLESRITVYHKAVIDTTKNVTFFIGPSHETGKADGSAGRKDVDYKAAITVEGISLDDFVFRDGNPEPNIIKMDVEGGEVLALPGMRRILKEIKPTVFLEIHGPEAAEKAYETFIENDYQMHSLEKEYPLIESAEDLGWKAYTVAIPKGKE